MTRTLITAVVALADTLAAENAALDRLDLAAAAALLPAKTRAMADFSDATTATLDTGDAALVRSVRHVADRLRDQADRNRLLLERAIMVQGRVVEAVVAAVPRPARFDRYSARGAMARHGTDAMALLARA